MEKNRSPFNYHFEWPLSNGGASCGKLFHFAEERAALIAVGAPPCRSSVPCSNVRAFAADCRRRDAAVNAAFYDFAKFGGPRVSGPFLPHFAHSK
jgi:hypothetical protein